MRGFAVSIRVALKTQFTRILRRILFLWVRVESFPAEDPETWIDRSRPTLYVLAGRGLSDLLVLIEATQKLELPNPLARNSLPALKRHHSVYSLALRNPLLDWIRRRRKHSPMLQDILRVVGEDPELDLQLVPVSVFWGRPLARQKHWIQVLFADTWAVAGRTRRFFTTLFHGRNTRLIFSQPLSLRDLVERIGNDEAAVHDHLLGLLNQQREATFGPRIQNRKQMTAAVIEDENVKALISEQADSTLKSYTRAQRYCREIFADCTQLTIEIMLRLLRAFWNRFYSGVETYNIERIRETALTHQLVYVPCHRSHVDYLLLSYVIYTENLALPYIAAGNNLNIPFIGRILRGGGAFFIRRSFRDNPIYTAVIRSYVGKLVEMGIPLEYFVEGGRSRTGRMLKPRFGMLGMTVEAYLKSNTRPLAFVPVYIGYEKLIEGKSYLGELYGGKKKRESTLGALGAIFRLKGHFGTVTASFGQPIDLQKLIEEHCKDWRNSIDSEGEKPEWYRSALNQLGQEIMHGINRACVVNPVNTITTVLLATPRQSIEMEELVDQGRLHQRMISRLSATASIRISGDIERAQIEHIAKQKVIRIREHSLGDIVYLEPEAAVLASYYRNNSLHSLIFPAVIACCFANDRNQDIATVARRVRLLYPFLRSELQLEWDSNDLQPIIEECVAIMVDESLLIRSGHRLSRPERSDRSYHWLTRMGQTVQPILERYYMTFTVLWQSSSAPLTEPELEHRCHLLAQKTSMIYGINSPDFYDRLLFRDFIDTLLEWEYVVTDADDRLVFAEGFDYVSLDLRNLLSTEVRSSIQALISFSPK